MDNIEIKAATDEVTRVIQSKPTGFKLNFCELCEILPDYDPELLSSICLVLADAGRIRILSDVDMSGNVSVACIYTQ